MEKFPQQIIKKEQIQPNAIEKTDAQEAEQETLDAEYFGNKFKEILKANGEKVDSHIKEMSAIVGGEEYLEADRNANILKKSLYELIKIPGFPKDAQNRIEQSLRMLEMYNPDMDRHYFYSENDPLSKEMRVDTHNMKLGAYTETIRSIFNTLEEVLPESMVTELRARGGMFFEIFKVIDKENSEDS